MLSEILVDSENVAVGDPAWREKMLHAMVWWHTAKRGTDATIVRSYGKVKVHKVASLLWVLGFDRDTVESMAVGQTLRGRLESTGIEFEHTHVADGPDVAEAMLIEALELRIAEDPSLHHHVLLASGDHLVADHAARSTSSWYHFVTPGGSAISTKFGTSGRNDRRKWSWESLDPASAITLPTLMMAYANRGGASRVARRRAARERGPGERINALLETQWSDLALAPAGSYEWVMAWPPELRFAVGPILEDPDFIELAPQSAALLERVRAGTADSARSAEVLGRAALLALAREAGADDGRGFGLAIISTPKLRRFQKLLVDIQPLLGAGRSVHD
jgi:hypothetical protein